MQAPEQQREGTMMKSAERPTILDREGGIAMLTVLMLTVILTVIGIAAITTTTLDLRMAGGERLRETSVNASEACVSSAVQIIQQTLANAAIPTLLLPGASANPCIGNFNTGTGACTTKPLGTGVGQNPIQAEIMGQSDENADSADPGLGAASPNAVLSLGSFTVNMDIDRLYAKPQSGGSLAFGAGSEGTGGAASIEILYRIDCFARNNTGATQVAGRVTGVYACVATGESCQRKI
jgi:Tfp pilus assembly protein PilX